MFLEGVTGASKTSELAVHTPVIETNGEAKIVPHIIQEKLRSTKNKVNLHQPPIIAARTSPTVIHMRHVHMAIENAKPLFQNKLNQSVFLVHLLSPIPHGPMNSTWSHSSASPMQALKSPPTNGICPPRTTLPKKNAKFYTHGELHHLWPTKLESSKQTKQSVSDQRGMTKSTRRSFKAWNTKSSHFVSNRYDTQIPTPQWSGSNVNVNVNPVCPIGQPVSGTGGEIVKLHPIYINTCKTPKIQAGLNAKIRHQLQRPPMKVNSSSGKNL